MQPSFVNINRSFVSWGMTISNYKVSERGQMALPADARRRWKIVDGGTVEVADLGDAVLVVPAGNGGLRAMLGNAISEAGGYDALVERVVNEEPDLA